MVRVVVAWLKKFLRGLLRENLPVALLLACLFTTIDVLAPDALRATDTFFMRAGYRADAMLGWAFESAATATHLQHPKFAHPAATIVMLTPAANARYLHRTSPVPRGRLACLLFAMSESMHELDLPPAVIGIDIDVTPLEMQKDEKAWEPLGDEDNCVEAMKTAAANPGMTVTAAIEFALARLGQRHCIVAITVPRPDGGRSLRDDFINRVSMPGTRATEGSQLPCKGVVFASPMVVQVPHEPVYEYPGERLPTSGMPQPLRAAFDSAAKQGVEWPVEFCSLGRAMGGVLHRLKNHSGHTACSGDWGQKEVEASAAPAGPSAAASRPSLPIVALAEAARPAAYRPNAIKLGAARSAISYSTIDVAGTADDDDLFDAARKAFGNLQPSDIYVLTIDSGDSTEDKFLVPVLDVPVPGAWVHAAVAWTEYDAIDHRAAGHHPPHPVVSYLIHVLIDVGIALLFAGLLELGVLCIASIGHEVPRESLFALLPVVLLFCFVWAGLHRVNHGHALGDWHSPVPVLLGMLAHVYIDLASKQRHAGAAPGPPQVVTSLTTGHHPTAAAAPAEPAAPGDRLRHLLCDPWRLAFQWVWCGALMASLLLGLRPAWSSSWPMVLVLSAVLACAYLLFARWTPFAPLPWRPHESDSHDHAHS